MGFAQVSYRIVNLKFNDFVFKIRLPFSKFFVVVVGMDFISPLFVIYLWSNKMLTVIYAVRLRIIELLGGRESLLVLQYTLSTPSSSAHPPSQA